MPIKWQPFKELDKFQQDMDRYQGEEEWVPFAPNFKMEEPAMDIYQDNKNVYVEVPLIGIRPEDVEISVEDNILTLSGKTEEVKEKKQKDYLRKEIRKGSFRRSVKLPVEVRGKKASAESKMGLLKITLPKNSKTAVSSNKIPIQIK